MAENDMLHTAEILKAAMPSFDSRSRSAIDLLVKVVELISSLKNLRNRQLSVSETKPHTIDVETLLSSIKPVCNDHERPMVETMLNMFQAKRVMEMYNNYMSMMKAMEEPNNASDEFTKGSNAFSGNFSAFDFSSFFGNQTDSEYNDNHDENLNIDVDVNLSNIFGTENSIPKNITSYEGYSEDDDSIQNEDSSGSYDSEDKSSAGNSNISNSPMMNMLMSMIPPEQKSTYENLRMFLSTMSNEDKDKAE